MRFLLLALAGCDLEDLDGDGVTRADDCNDRDPSQGAPVALHVDGDGDGFGGSVVEVGCAGNSWLTEAAGDCDDVDPTVFPGATEVGCDGRDNDCDRATPDGPAYTTGSTWPSVQAAIDAAGYSDVVRVCASRIDEAIVVGPTPVTLIGQGSGLTVLDASGSGTAAVEVRGVLTLSGVTLTGGTGVVGPDGARLGGGLSVDGCHVVILDDVVVEGNSADAGGGIGSRGCGSVHLSSTIVRDNEAEDGGGLFLDGGASLFVTSTVIESNTAARGGGLHVADARIAVLDDTVTVAGNAASEGGGVWLADGTLDASGARLSANTAVAGGGLYGQGVLLDAAVSDNAADRGGGVLVAGTLEVRGSSLTGSVATLGDGGGALVPDGSTLVLRDTSIESGTAAGRGGGVHAEGTVELDDVRIEAGAAVRGGGVSCDGCVLTGSQVELRDDVAAEQGGAIDVDCAGYVDLASGHVTGGTAPDGAAAAVAGGALVLSSTTATGNVADVGGAWFAVRSDCGGYGAFYATAVTVDDVPDALSVADTVTLVPGPSFSCTADPLGGGACTVP